MSDFIVIPDETQVLTWSQATSHAPFYNRDIRKMDLDLQSTSVRPLIEFYYHLQQMRVQLATQAQVLHDAGLDNQLHDYYAGQLQKLEKSMIRPLDDFVQQSVPGRWATAQYGIGPVLAAGLLAHIDITKAKTAGSVWRYAGLDPSINSDTARKRSWNPELKNLSWKIGQSFMRFAHDERCFYGHLYLMDKKRRHAKNDAGDFAATAQRTLTNGTQLDTASRADLEAGRLPDSHIDAQARRFAVKIFLSHYHAVAYQDHYNVPAPRPYHIDHDGGSIEVSIPHFPFEKDL